MAEALTLWRLSLDGAVGACVSLLSQSHVLLHLLRARKVPIAPREQKRQHERNVKKQHCSLSFSLSFFSLSLFFFFLSLVIVIAT